MHVDQTHAKLPLDGSDSGSSQCRDPSQQYADGERAMDSDGRRTSAVQESGDPGRRSGPHCGGTPSAEDESAIFQRGIGILFRANSQARVIEQALRVASILIAWLVE